MNAERKIELAEFGKVSTTLTVDLSSVEARHYIIGPIAGIASVTQRMTADDARAVALAYLAAAEELERGTDANADVGSVGHVGGERPDRDERIEEALAKWYSDKNWATSYTTGEAGGMRECMGRVLDADARTVETISTSDREALIELAADEIGDWSCRPSVKALQEAARVLWPHVGDANGHVAKAVGEAMYRVDAQSEGEDGLWSGADSRIITLRRQRDEARERNHQRISEIHELKAEIERLKAVDSLVGTDYAGMVPAEVVVELDRRLGKSGAALFEARAEADRLREERREGLDKAGQFRRLLAQRGKDAVYAEDELERLRAAKPLSTDLLRNPTHELVRAYCNGRFVSCREGKSPNTAQAVHARGELKAVANALDAQHSSSSLDGEGGDAHGNLADELEAIVRNALPDQLDDEACGVLNSAAHLLRSSPSPSVGLTVEEAEALLKATAWRDVGALHAGKAVQQRIRDRLSAVSGGPDQDGGGD